MKIQAITPFNVYTNTQNLKKQQKTNVQNNAYNPIAYNDLTFTARLFRTPENFYAQPFNKNGMPETMKDYLNADYLDRQKMPPAQMLKLVFDDINETKNLEQVKRIFPDEPLFKDLTDTPNRKAKTGILAEIDVMREENKSLFKNGKDNLGHYILKKIYTEAKTLKEINADFKKDVSVHYNGLSPIEYDTLRAFGIKFPNNSFWKSLTATREEFPYEYKPRKPIESRSAGNLKPVSTARVIPQKNRFEHVKDWEVDKLSDALIKGKGSADETKKQLKKTSVRDEASLGFVAKYMSEINSVVLERLQVSPEMSYFFDSPELLSKSQKQKMDAYWQDNGRRELRSFMMKDTIQMFFNAYGVDGQNEEFQELLDYAHNIKPNRLAEAARLQKLHDEKQAYYDEMFAELDKLEAQPQVSEEIVHKSTEELLQDVVKQYDVNEYRFDTAEGEVVIVGNLQEALEENLRAETNFMPRAISNKFIKFVKEHNSVSDAYILSKLLAVQDVELPEDDRLMSADDVVDTTVKLYTEFSNKNMLDCRAAQQAVAEIFTKFPAAAKVNPQVLTLGVFEFIPILNMFSKEGRQVFLRNSDFVNSKYSEYRRPLSDGEARKISMQVFDLLRNYRPNNTVIDVQSPYAGFETTINEVACYMKNQNPSDLKQALVKYIKEFGGSARYFLDKDASKDLKMAKLEQLLVHYSYDHPVDFHKFAVSDEEGIAYIKYNNPQLYHEIIG